MSLATGNGRPKATFLFVVSFSLPVLLARFVSRSPQTSRLWYLFVLLVALAVPLGFIYAWYDEVKEDPEWDAIKSSQELFLKKFMSDYWVAMLVTFIGAFIIMSLIWYFVEQEGIPSYRIEFTNCMGIVLLCNLVMVGVISLWVSTIASFGK